MTIAVESFEFHNGRLESVTVEASGTARLVFAHMSAYGRSPGGADEVWSARVFLRLDGLHSFAITGELANAKWITDGRIDSGGQQWEPEPERTYTDARVSLEVVGTENVRLTAHADRARVEHFELLRYMEPWPE